MCFSRAKTVRHLPKWTIVSCPRSVSLGMGKVSAATAQSPSGSLLKALFAGAPEWDCPIAVAALTTPLFLQGPCMLKSLSPGAATFCC